MSTLAYRRNSVQRLVGSTLAPAASYTVVVYKPGAQVNGNQSSVTSVTVRAGHGLVAGDMACVVSGGAVVANTLQAVSTVDATHVNFSTAISVSNGDYILNLGADGGSTTPDWAGSDATIYSDMAGGTSITNSQVTTDSGGEYEYWSKTLRVWEVVLNGSTLLDVVPFVGGHRDDGYIYVDDFGAVGDGDPDTYAGTDDTVAIQAALNYANTYGANGGFHDFPETVVLSNKTYAVSNLTIYPRTRLIGKHVWGSTLIPVSGMTGAMIKDSGNGTRISIENLRVEGDATWTGPAIELGTGTYQFQTQGYIEKVIVRKITDGTGVIINGNAARVEKLTCIYCKTGLDIRGGGNFVDDYEYTGFDGTIAEPAGGATALTCPASSTVFRDVYVEGFQTTPFTISGSTNTFIGVRMNLAENITSIFTISGSGQNNKIDDFVFTALNGYTVTNLVNDTVNTEAYPWPDGTSQYSHKYWEQRRENLYLVSLTAGNNHPFASPLDTVYFSGLSGTAQYKLPLLAASKNEEFLVINDDTYANQRVVESIPYDPTDSNDNNLDGFERAYTLPGHVLHLKNIGGNQWKILNRFVCVYGFNGENARDECMTEDLTIAAAADSTTSVNLLPANSIITAVIVRVITVIPTAVTFNVGDGTTPARFATGVAVAQGTTSVGLNHWKGGVSTDATGPTQSSAAAVVITPNATPAAATGVVRITVFFKRFTTPAGT